MISEHTYYGDDGVRNPSDEEIWNRFRLGDKTAFELIFKKYNPLLYHFGIKFFYDRYAVEDCIQELFLTLWKKRETLPEVTTVKYYLITSLRRLLIRNAVILKRDSDLSKMLNNLQVSSHENQIIDEQFLNEKNEKLNLAIQQLPPRQKEAIYLRFYEEKSYEEITFIMSVNYQTARKFIYKALQVLRKNFSANPILNTDNTL